MREVFADRLEQAGMDFLHTNASGNKAHSGFSALVYGLEDALKLEKDLPTSNASFTLTGHARRWYDQPNGGEGGRIYG